MSETVRILIDWGKNAFGVARLQNYMMGQNKNEHLLLNGKRNIITNI
jgi:hypothetical protein